MSRPSGNMAVALIAAASALGGTAVGAFVSYEGDLQLQNRQVNREEAREAKSARAVARLLMSEYHAAAVRLEEMLGEREFLPSVYRERTFVSHIGQEDRKLLAGQLTESHWVEVSKASSAIEEVQADMEAHGGRGRIDLEEAEALEAAGSECNTAYNALRPLAGGAGVS